MLSRCELIVGWARVVAVEVWEMVGFWMCFEVITDKTGWQTACGEWEKGRWRRHSGVIPGSELSTPCTMRKPGLPRSPVASWGLFSPGHLLFWFFHFSSSLNSLSVSILCSFSPFLYQELPNNSLPFRYFHLIPFFIYFVHFLFLVVSGRINPALKLRALERVLLRIMGLWDSSTLFAPFWITPPDTHVRVVMCDSPRGNKEGLHYFRANGLELRQASIASCFSGFLSFPVATYFSSAVCLVLSPFVWMTSRDLHFSSTAPFPLKLKLSALIFPEKFRFFVSSGHVLEEASLSILRGHSIFLNKEHVLW